MHTVKGQTMIEVIVALTLIILFLSGVVVVELFAIKNADFARHKSVSTQLARQQIERARVVRDLTMASLTDCPLPTIIPLPISYKARAIVDWSQGLSGITPAPQVEVSSCITDWR